MTSTTRPGLLSLPNELLSVVLSHLTVKYLFVLSGVCRGLRAFVETQIFPVRWAAYRTAHVAEIGPDFASVDRADPAYRPTSRELLALAHGPQKCALCLAGRILPALFKHWPFGMTLCSKCTSEHTFSTRRSVLDASQLQKLPTCQGRVLKAHVANLLTSGPCVVDSAKAFAQMEALIIKDVEENCLKKRTDDLNSLEDTNAEKWEGLFRKQRDGHVWKRGCPLTLDFDMREFCGAITWQDFARMAAAKAGSMDGTSGHACPFCTREFRFENGLRSHMWAKHQSQDFSLKWFAASMDD